LEHAPLVLFAVDREGRLILLQGGELSRLGLTANSHLGESVFKIKNIPLKKMHFKRALKGFEFSVTTQVNHTVYETYLTRLGDKNGKIIGVVGLASDVTARIKAEQALD